MIYFNKKKIFTLLNICLAFPLGMSEAAYAQENLVPVLGFARSFVLGLNLSDAKITLLETGTVIQTDKKGRFKIMYPVGKPLTLVFEKFGYKTTQSETVIVPPGGLIEPTNEISFQIPSLEVYYLYSTIIGAKYEKDKCHIATTILAPGKTMDDVPQGEVDAQVTLLPNMNEKPFYFDIVKDGPLKGKTNPFTKDLKSTSADGGVAYFNLPPSDKPYTITASKAGIVFSSAQFLCRPDAFINISPPRGPMANY